MTKKLLFDVADEDPSLDFKVNKNYAKRFEERKKAQELGQLEDKYKAKLEKKGIFKETNDDSDSDYSDSESDEEEDEFGEQLTPAVDAQILKTLSEIRAGSAKIYDPSVSFFSEEELKAIEKEWQAKHGESNKAKIARNQKPVTLKDYQRERLLSGAYAQDDEDEDENQREPEPLTHVQEQEQLKREMLDAFKADALDSDSDSDGLFKARPKTAEEIAREEEEYRNFLLENLATSENAKESMSEWLSYREEKDGKKPRKTAAQNKDDAFLIDYVLNQGWMDKTKRHTPSYDEIVTDASESEEELEKAEEFEAALNFRFEQEGGTEIQTYARTIEGSLRREESKRKEQRAAAKARKAEEKARKAEEIKRLKNLKMAEIRKKLEKIQKVAKVEALANEDELIDELADGEFDPAKHDALMSKIAQQFDGDEDNEKPVFSDMSDVSEDEEEQVQKTKAVKTARKTLKSVLKQHKEQAKTDGVEAHRLAAAMEELYQLDYEDLIGDIPCRFKYQRVEPNNLGLEVDDILNADDADLNKYFALKKLAPYRPTDVLERDINKYATSERLRDLRRAIKSGNHKPSKKSKKEKKDE